MPKLKKRIISPEEEAKLIEMGWQAPQRESVPATSPTIKEAIKDHRGFIIKLDVYNAIVEAAEEVGVDPGYMFAMAGQESAFKPKIKAKTSSATGLYQFIDATWEDMVNKYGKQYAIGIQDRKCPRANAMMGALFTKNNAEFLRGFLGREPTPGELYAAHFLGAGGAKKLFNASPGTNAATLLKSAAKANRSIFYDNGRPREVTEVRQILAKKIEPHVIKYNKLLTV